MKRTVAIILTGLALVGCIGNSSSSAKLELNAEQINFCGRPMDDTVFWNNLQLRNTGKGILTISSIAVRGDERCAFTCEYPDPSGNGKLIPCVNEGTSFSPFALDAGHTLLLRVGYTPSSLEEGDVAALVIHSDAANLLEGEAKTAVSEIGICGHGVAGDAPTDVDDAAADAGVPMDGGTGDGECVACGDLPEKGAPSCEDRR